MSDIEEMMKEELLKLSEAIKKNQKEYRDLQRAYEKKRKAMHQWFRPTVLPRVRKEQHIKTSEPKKEDTPAEPQETN